MSTKDDTDVPSHCFQYTFTNDQNWSKFYSPGTEIGNYFKDLAEKYQVKKFTRFGHMFRSAKWLEDKADTNLRLEDNLVNFNEEM
jgi:cation diffusion facilitator CzcD-associated flavoprotein CzcO